MNANNLTDLIGSTRKRVAWKAEVLRGAAQLRVARDRPLSAHDREAFRKVLDVWKPENEKPVIILRWLISEWCNYACPYCIQSHGRKEDKGGGMTAHGFDNFPVEKWLEAFDRHFADKRLSFVITGGEPFIDRVSMRVLLPRLAAMENVTAIRIDTNAWWNPDEYRDLDKSKITLMCTLHPSHTTVDKFVARIDAILEAGFRIGIVNYVMSGSNIAHYLENRERLKERGIPLHPNPLWDSEGQYSKEDLALLKEALPEVDYGFRTGIVKSCGGKCVEPSLAYELNYKGEIHVACFEQPEARGSIFDDELPRLFRGVVHCPHQTCVALDQYSFQERVNRNVGLDPLRIYGDHMRAFYGIEPVDKAEATKAG
ncbi:MAG: radical SAM protein [Capsulimonadaceae bacterium]|nr:radical SAM protein [Capsulimonadaceae bacterium]